MSPTVHTPQATLGAFAVALLALLITIAMMRNTDQQLSELSPAIALALSTMVFFVMFLVPTKWAQRITGQPPDAK